MTGRARRDKSGLLTSAPPPKSEPEKRIITINAQFRVEFRTTLAPDVGPVFQTPLRLECCDWSAAGSCPGFNRQND